MKVRTLKFHIKETIIFHLHTFQEIVQLSLIDT